MQITMTPTPKQNEAKKLLQDTVSDPETVRTAARLGAEDQDRKYSTPKHMDVEAIISEFEYLRFNDWEWHRADGIELVDPDEWLRTTLTTQATQYEESLREVVKEAIRLSDDAELQYPTEFNEWRAFKGFRNGLHDFAKNRAIDISDKIK